MKKENKIENWEKELEQIFLNRIKNIGEKDQTYLGYPDELLKELKSFIRQLLLQKQLEALDKLKLKKYDDLSNWEGEKVGELFEGKDIKKLKEELKKQKTENLTK